MPGHKDSGGMCDCTYVNSYNPRTGSRCIIIIDLSGRGRRGSESIMTVDACARVRV